MARSGSPSVFTLYCPPSDPIPAVKKMDLPQKTCPVCQRPFAWRKKWRDLRIYNPVL